MKPKHVFKRLFTKTKEQHFEQELQRVDWSPVYECTTGNLAYNTFQNIFLDLMNRIFVVKKLNCLKRSESWITNGIKISCRHKRVLCYKKTKGQVSGLFFSKYCSILKKVIIKAKQMANRDFIEGAENKVKATWRIVKDVTDRSSKDSTIIENFMHKYNEYPVKFVNTLNNYFINSCPSVMSQIIIRVW